MAAPTFGSAGTYTAQATQDTFNVPYPATVNSGDIAYLVLATDDTTASSTPGDWTPMTDDVASTTSGPHKCRMWWRRCDGSEGGTNVSLTAGSSGSGSTLRSAVIFTIAGAVASGDPNEDFRSQITENTGGGLFSHASGTTTTGTERLAVRVYMLGDNPNSADITAWAEPGGWTAQIEVQTAVGSDAQLAIDTKQVATASTEAQTSRTGAASVSGVVFEFAVIPPPGGGPQALEGAATAGATASADASVTKPIEGAATAGASASGQLAGGASQALEGAAISGAAASADLTVRHFEFTLYEVDGATPLANKTGLWWAWWDVLADVRSTAPDASGTGASTDASGVFSVVAPSALSAGANQGFGIISDQDATPDATEAAYVGSFDVV